IGVHYTSLTNANRVSRLGFTTRVSRMPIGYHDWGSLHESHECQSGITIGVHYTSLTNANRVSLLESV
ncbi:MAG: hypothetical protein QXG97_00070, partial [Nitrososphaerota archaeon]